VVVVAQRRHEPQRLQPGQQSDPLIARAYRFDEDVHTLIAADEFRTAYLKTHIVYSNQFLLDANSPELWTLYDDDMEWER